MVKSELVKRSPLRLLEQSIHGGLGPGTVGVIASRKGTGKTAFLVHLATDQLLQGKHVIHISFSGRTDHIVSWYEDIFGEIAKKRHLEDAMEVHDELIKHRVIMNFNQEGVSADQLLASVRAMIGEGNFSANTIVVDGYDFQKGSAADVRAIKALAAEVGCTVWFSASVHRDDPEVDERGVPRLLSPYIGCIAVLFTLRATDKHLKLSLIKDHDQYSGEDPHLMLDPKSLLIAEEEV
jgi:hypothetical protein